ncbi:hypothetical protein X797_011703 [Metarhizium robertsii]|uniref:Uncharacterized protein n=1 Tax=Metarhizium robertsii TaxID=568076 RepID=A0A014N6C9_9HYPO|nr:hypothetical protein X797_011703 [Metarhizium robertsii]
MPRRHNISPGRQENVFSQIAPSQLYPMSTPTFTNNWTERTADEVSRYEDICGRFIKFNAKRDFFDTWETVVDSWTALLRITSLPSNKPIRRTHVITAVNALGSVINGHPGVSLPARFGYFQLANFLDALEFRIRSERDTWPNALDWRRGRYTTIAYDMYLDALSSDPRAKSPRQEVLRRRLIGRRWRAYAEPSSLLLAVYSDFAETFMYISAHTEREAELGRPWDVSIVQDLRRHVENNLV